MSKRKFIIHLRQELRNHTVHYLVLFSFGVFFIVFLNMFRGFHLKQFFVVLVFVNFYVGWGIVHHANDKTLSAKTVLEYILIGATVLFLFEMLLVR